MPVASPGNRAQTAAEAFKETTAPYRKTGPAEKIAAPSDRLKKQIVDALAPVASRADELTSEGKKLTVQTIRAAEVAAKLQKGQAIAPSEIAQAQISVIEALETGLEDKDSPYYQADDAMRIQRATELENLREELNAYLTGEGRTPYDTTVTVTRRRWARVGIPLPLIRRLRIFPGRENYDVTETRRVTPDVNEPLTPAGISRANEQSRIYESYDNQRRRIAKDRFGKEWDNLTPTERRITVYSAGEQVSKQFRDQEARTLITAAKAGEKDLIDDALENGSAPEKALAKRMQKYNEDTESVMRRSKELGRIKTVAQFKKFMGLDDLSITNDEVQKAIVEYLGITDEKELAKLKDPDKAFRRLFETDGELGVALFTGRLYEWKLEKFAGDRADHPEPEERSPGENPIGLSKETILGLDKGGLAILMAEGKLTGIDDLKKLGISEDQARELIAEGEKVAKKTSSGSYEIEDKALGTMSDSDLTALMIRRGVNLGDPAQAADLQTKLENSFKDMGIRNPADRTKMATDKINNILNNELHKITNGSLSEAHQKKILNKWDQKSLGLLSLLLGGTFLNRMLGLNQGHELRSFQAMFT